MAINPIIKQKAEDIRKKIFGSEVRESLASGIEAISEDVEATISRQDYVEEQFQNVIDETTDKDVISAPELIAARNGKSNLKTRLDEEHAQVTAQLAQKANYDEVNSLIGNVAIGTPLFADSVSGMTDQTRLYVNTTDGLIYNHNGSAFISTGKQYQSTGIENKSVTSEKLNPFLSDRINDIANLSLLSYVKSWYESDVVLDESFIDYSNPVNKLTWNTNFSGWSSPFLYNGKRYTGIKFARITLDVDAYVTVSINLKNDFSNPILKSTRFVRGGFDGSILFPLSVSGLDVNEVYYVTLATDVRSTLSVSGFNGTPAGGEYLAPIDTVASPSYYMDEQRVWRKSVDKTYQVVFGLVDEKGITIKKPYDIIEEPIRTFLPIEVECVIGEKFELFLDSIISAKDHKIYHVSFDGTLTGVTIYDRKIYIPEVKADTGGTGNLIFKNDLGRIVATQSLKIKPYPKRNPSTKKNILIIGDSLTARNRIVTSLESRFVDEGISNVDFIGTMGSGSAMHEGREGWSLALYSGSGQVGNPNPFWNPTTEKVDFLNYCTTNGYTGIDYVIVHLNWNDDIHNPEAMADKYENFCNKILSDYPNCKILITSLSAYSKNKFSSSAWNRTTKDTVFNMSEAYQRMTDKHPNMETVHILHQKDEDYAATFTSIPVSVRNTSITENITNDHVHCSNVGYDQIADSYYRKLTAQLNKDLA